ncbi:MAG: hypothetical protein M0C28_31510 [Candidatus Moduliflexus flocculans]|nr:hypothetical protein [Candidatus Moduliflexus flocculans]
MSIVDFIKRMNQAMHDGDPAFYTIPESKDLVAQYLLAVLVLGRGDELDSFVNYDFKKAQILLQMKSQSGYLAQDVVDTVERFREEGAEGGRSNGHLHHRALPCSPRSSTSIVVTSQIRSFIFSFILCFFITAVVFRSLKLGVYSMMPLLIPITLDFCHHGRHRDQAQCGNGHGGEHRHRHGHRLLHPLS